MDAATKRKHGEQVRRLVSKLLGPFGLARTKSTFWTRPRESVVEFVHLHLYTFGPVFRIHLGIRVLNDPRDYVTLNGPESTFWQDKGKFHFSERPDAVERCAREVLEWCQRVGEPWYAKWRDLDLLLDDTQSPLDDTAKVGLRSSRDGAANGEFVGRSRKELGVA